MSRPIEERLRAAYEAKADQVSAERLEQLAARRQQSLLDGADDWQDQESSISLFDGAVADPDEPTPLDPGSRPPGTRHARWLAPALAAAAVAAIAVAVTAVATSSSNGKHAPNPPATQVTSPSPSSSSSPSASPSPSTSASTPVAGPPYLPRGQQGSRSQVPWSAVGPGWRLVLPYSGTSPASLYLYDPAGGRYLISDRLPAKVALQAWSPDGTRAMLRGYDSDGYRYQEVSLRSGQLSTAFGGLGEFISYTQPKGLAVLVQDIVGNGATRLVRYSTTGHLEHTYATDLPGHGKLDAQSGLYLPDGSAFVTAILPGPLALVANGGQLVRSYPLPAGHLYCRPLKWWTADTVLEVCLTPAGPGEPAAALYLQPVAGGAPSVLTEAAGRTGGGYDDAWLLSNGHVLLANHVSCGTGTYDILVSGKAPRPLRGPAGVSASARIISMAGDLATFAVSDSSTCGGLREASVLVDYDMVTGQTHQLLDRLATIVSWPAEPS